MAPPTLQGIVNGLADRLGLPVVLEDADQQLLVYSPHHEVTDPIREETILRRATAQRVVDHFEPFDLATHVDPFVIPAAPDRQVLARLCVPVRYADTILGYVWVLLPDGRIDPSGRAAAEEARDHLSLAMLAESRTRVREGDSVRALLADDPETRVQGLMDIEARGGFDPPRRLLVIVCSGPAWGEAAVRGALWTASWADVPDHQLRSATTRDGVALVSLPPSRTTDGADDAGDQDAVLRRAHTHLLGGRSGAAARLVLGVGSVTSTPDRAHEAYRQARLAARVALRDARMAPVAWWDRIGVYRILAELPTGALAEAIDPRLTRLVTDHPDLALTLEHYLDHAGAITAVAASLHIHRTTLYQRLDRVRAAGLDPTSGLDRMTAHTGLAALRLLGRWPLAGNE